MGLLQEACEFTSTCIYLEPVLLEKFKAADVDYLVDYMLIIT